MRCFPNGVVRSVKFGVAVRATCLSRALDHERQRLAGAGAHQKLHVGEGLDAPAIDLQDQVFGQEPGLLGGAPRLRPPRSAVR